MPYISYLTPHLTHMPTSQRVEAAVQDLSHVEVCLNCSSASLRMVTDVFYYALKSVLYPLQPLYDRCGETRS